MEPLIGPVDLSPWVPALEWVVVGGESGPNSRPMETGWTTDAAAMCRSAGTAFWMKQKGEVWAKLNGADEGDSRTQDRVRVSPLQYDSCACGVQWLL